MLFVALPQPMNRFLKVSLLLVAFASLFAMGLVSVLSIKVPNFAIGTATPDDIVQ